MQGGCYSKLSIKRPVGTFLKIFRWKKKKQEGLFSLVGEKQSLGGKIKVQRPKQPGLIIES